MSVLDALDDRQREAAAMLRGPVAVLAGAGTGKTRVITHRIAHGVDTGAYSPSRVMAVTFTAKAAGELRGRLRALGVAGVAARTFHAAALRQLNFFWPTITGDPAPSIIDNKVRMLGQAADAMRLRPSTATLRDIASEIEWRKVSMLTIEQYAELERPISGIRPEQLVELQAAYEQLKDDRRQLDFEDVLLACAGMLESEPRVAAAVHEQYRHFTVDEFQDVSPLQNRLLELWLGDRRDICVVGDASQTIYSFAGAQQRYLLEFDRRYPDATVVRLETNYRSQAPILDAANALMRGRPGALALVPRAAGIGSETPTLTAYDSEREEADGIADAIIKRIGTGASPADIAVLYRAHSQSAVLQQALAARGIATSVLGGTRFFDMPEVRQSLLALRGAAVAPTDTGFLPTVRDVLRGLGLTEEPPAAGGAQRDGWEARRAILRLAEEAPVGTTLRAFADDLMARAQDQHEPVLHTVTLSTLHAAKGLEWPHVLLAGWAEGALPISYASTFEQVDEERRLAYVGITRAARTLAVSWSRSAGRGERPPSRFLAEIGTTSRGTGILRDTAPSARRSVRQARPAPSTPPPA
ncbi:ATP-dependent helicase [Microbacterium esteraromaticum]|uniref:DNA 3'-5' helicase n=2 Tax=Microbacterium esteraromaticum TaxID=57043 RepID=A0A939DVH3_9MICO|nr:ATP-dependent helicase [Microbacterium esteraromaticum]MBN7793046.1 ATP-dependent helicase [Microbacterium esteraromaticum]MBN8205666.1 ATP-dependent helicase [Microbacterium esteraromaticum]MBN8415820.1 ATP-dependent helicase [Microbacterium esteraromaticum]MBN8423835.1 ATP-dependent helicase [Microbacterium esteraromaticum]